MGVDRPSWNEWFLDLADFIASRSKDPSTKCGAVIVRPDLTIASTGYNGFPRAISDHPDLLNNREEKYRRVIHAEMNAILTAKEQLKGYTLYVTPFPPCERCAVCIIQAGISRVITRHPTQELFERWGESLKLSLGLFREAGVVVMDAEGNGLYGEALSVVTR